MAMITLPNGRTVLTNIKSSSDGSQMTVCYDDVRSVLNFDEHYDLYTKSEGDPIPDEVVDQVNEITKGEKIDYTEYGHFYISIDDETGRYYAHCNVDHFPGVDGIEPNTGILHVYLLDPRKGSVVTTLESDANTETYVVSEGSPELEESQLAVINQAYKDYIRNLK